MAKTTALTAVSNNASATDVFISELPAKQDDGLSTGAKIGIGIAIGIGSVVVIGGVSYVVVRLVEHHNKKKAEKEAMEEAAPQYYLQPLPNNIAPQNGPAPVPGPIPMEFVVPQQPIPQPVNVTPAPQENPNRIPLTGWNDNVNQPQQQQVSDPQPVMVPVEDVNKILASNQQLQQQVGTFNTVMEQAQSALAAKDTQINNMLKDLQVWQATNVQNANQATANKAMLDALYAACIAGGSTKEELDNILQNTLNNLHNGQQPTPVNQ